METYIIDKEFPTTEKEHLDLDNTQIPGNLLIIGTNFRTISIEKSHVSGNIIVINNKSSLELSNSTIDGSIFLFKIKGSSEIHLDGINTQSHKIKKEMKLIPKNKYSSKDDKYTITLENGTILCEENVTNAETKFTITKDERIEITLSSKDTDFLNRLKIQNYTTDNNLNTILLKEKSVFICDIQAQLNLDDSNFEGDVIIIDSSATSGTLGFSNSKFKKDLKVVSVGISSDIKALNSEFFGEVLFNDNRFDNEIYFAGSVFREKVYFIDCTFYQEIYFKKAQFSKVVEFSQAIFQSKVSFRDIEWRDSASMKVHDGSAFLGYVDFCGQDLNKYEFIAVRGLRNIFYSIVNEEKYSEEEKHQKDKYFPNIQSYITNLFNWIKSIENNKDISSFNRQIEVYVEGRRAMEDLAKEDLVSEFHILEMEAQRKKSFIEKNYFKTLRLWILKQATNYGESPFRIFIFILVDWIFFSLAYFTINLFTNAVHIDTGRMTYLHLDCKSSLVLSQSISSAMLQSTNNLLSLNSFFPCACNIPIIILTLFQGFINIMIVALMVQVVFRKLDLR